MPRKLKTVLWIITVLAVVAILAIIIALNADMGGTHQEHVFIDGSDAASLLNPTMFVVRVLTLLVFAFIIGGPVAAVIGIMWLVAYLIVKAKSRKKNLQDD